MVDEALPHPPVIMTREALAEKLSNLIERYHHSTIALELYVNFSLNSIVQHQSKMSDILDRFRRTLRGESVFEPGSDTVSVRASDLEELTKATSKSSHYYESHPQMTLEMSLIYAGALFDAFISDTLATILQCIPERLRSGRSLTVEEALRFNDRDELIQDLARREVRDLMYKNTQKQFEYFRTSYGVDTFANQTLAVSIADLIAAREHRNFLARINGNSATENVPQNESLVLSIADLTAIRERRNLVAHNNGLATAEYVARFKTGVSIGDRVVINAETTELDRIVLSKVAISLVSGLREKLAPKADRRDDDTSGPTDPKAPKSR